MEADEEARTHQKAENTTKCKFGNGNKKKNNEKTIVTGRRGEEDRKGMGICIMKW